MHRPTRAITAGAAATVLAALLAFAGPAVAQEGDIDCGDPGTFHNMPVGPDDPFGLDADGDGIGCEDASVFAAAPEPAPEPAPVVEPEAAPVEAPPAAPVVRQPTFTG